MSEFPALLDILSFVFVTMIRNKNFHELSQKNFVPAVVQYLPWSSYEKFCTFEFFFFSIIKVEVFMALKHLPPRYDDTKNFPIVAKGNCFPPTVNPSLETKLVSLKFLNFIIFVKKVNSQISFLSR